MQQMSKNMSVEYRLYIINVNKVKNQCSLVNIHCLFYDEIFALITVFPMIIRQSPW